MSSRRNRGHASTPALYGGGPNGQAAPAAVVPTRTVPKSLAVSCVSDSSINATAAKIIQGSFALEDKNHQRPVYRKDMPEALRATSTVLIYFWDARDGEAFEGWWFGPKVGGDQVWCFNPDKSALVPPRDGWRIPWDGGVEKGMRIVYPGDVNLVDDRRRHSDCERNHDDDRRRREEEEEQQAWRQEESERRKRQQREQERRHREQQQEEDERRRWKEEEERRHREEEEEKARRREEEEARRREEEEDRRRQRAEERRAKETERRRKREEEERRAETAACLAVRKVIARLYKSDEGNLQDLTREVQAAIAEHGQAMGTQCGRVLQEAESAIRQAEFSVIEKKKQREKEEQKQKEKEDKTKVEAERAAVLLREASEAEEAILNSFSEAEASVMAIPRLSDCEPGEVIEAASEALTAVKDALASADKWLEDICHFQKELVGFVYCTGFAKDLSRSSSAISDSREKLSALVQTGEVAVSKAKLKAGAIKEKDEIRLRFEKFDVDGDGQLSRDEVAAFSLCYLGCEVDSSELTGILARLEPITLDKFHKLRQLLGIAIVEARSREQRAQAEERSRVLREQQQAFRKALGETCDLMGSIEERSLHCENKSKPLNQNQPPMPASEMTEITVEVEESMKDAAVALLEANEKIGRMETDVNSCVELANVGRKILDQLRWREERAKNRIDRVSSLLARAHEKIVRKAYAEMEEKKALFRIALQKFHGESGLTRDAFVEHISGGGAVSSGQFLDVLKQIGSLDLAEGEGKKLFSHLAGESDEVTKDQISDLLRVFYRCVKATTVSEEISIRGKNKRKLERNDIVEALEFPTREEGKGVLRVKCRVLDDGTHGWVTVEGNQGTPFLVADGNLFHCVRETLMTDAPAVQGSKDVRRIAIGEIIEVLEFPGKDMTTDMKRARCRAKLDGATGWVTIRGNEGSVFLEPL